jgi:hypothetical protein
MITLEGDMSITRFHPNSIHIHDNKTIAIHFKGKTKVAYVDLEDYNRIKMFKMSLTKKTHRYESVFCCIGGSSSGKGWRFSLGQLLLSFPEGLVVDHIDGNPLNNRKSNLRAVTVSDNQSNKTKSTGELKLMGVSKSGSKFRASIRFKNKWMYLGTFLSKESAYSAYKNKREELGIPICGLE